MDFKVHVLRHSRLHAKKSPNAIFVMRPIVLRWRPDVGNHISVIKNDIM